MLPFVFVLLAGFSACSFEAEDLAKVEIGGPRKVVAKIQKNDGNYEVEVRLIPVQCFDTTTNRLITLEKARQYALQALVRHLSAGKNQHGLIREAQVADSKMAGQFFVLLVKVPEKGVVILASGEGESERGGAENKKGGLKPALVRWEIPPLFTSKEDFLDTLAALVKTMGVLPMHRGDLDGFFEEIAQLEERMAKSFQALRKEVHAERFLLTQEKVDVVDKIGKEESRLIGILKDWVMEAEMKKSGVKQ